MNPLTGSFDSGVNSASVGGRCPGIHAWNMLSACATRTHTISPSTATALFYWELQIYDNIILKRARQQQHIPSCQQHSTRRARIKEFTSSYYTNSCAVMQHSRITHDYIARFQFRGEFRRFVTVQTNAQVFSDTNRFVLWIDAQCNLNRSELI